MVSILQWFNPFNIQRKKAQHTKNIPNTSQLSDDPLFCDCFVTYLKSLDGANRSRSYANDLAMASHILDGLGQYHMSEINKAVLKQFVYGFTKKTYAKGKGENQKIEYYSQSEINKIYNLLHAFIKEASSEDGGRLLKIDFMTNIKRPRSNQPKSPDTKPLSDRELKMLLDIVAENKMINLWINLLLFTGTRPSEPLAFSFADINYENKTIDVFHTLSQEEYVDPTTQKQTKPHKAIITDLKNMRDDGKINYQRRTLRVGDYIIGLLHDWEKFVKSDPAMMKMKKRHHTEELLFCGPRGQLWLYRDYKQVYTRLLKKHGLNVSEYTPYRFRHNCCTRLLRLKVDLKTVQRIMGDNTPDMILRVYANLDESDILRGSESYVESLNQTLDIKD